MKARTLNSQSAALVALAVVAAATQVAAARPAVAAPRMSLAQPVPYESMAQYNYSAWMRPTLQLVRSEAEWNSMMSQAVASGKALAAEPAPNVDWSKYTVVVVALGEVPNGCSVEVQGARARANGLELDVHVSLGGVNQSYTVSPSQVVAVARRNLSRVHLNVDATVAGLPTDATASASGASDGRLALRMHAATATSDAAPAPTSTNLSWGALKNVYR